MTHAEKVLIEAAVKWSGWKVAGKVEKGCTCGNCQLLRAVARVVRERGKK